MLREQQKFLDRFQIVVSGVLIMVSYCGLYWAMNDDTNRLRPFNEYLQHISLFTLVVMLVMYLRRFNISDRFIKPLMIFYELFICFILGAVISLGFLSYVLKFPQLSRLYLLGGIGVSYGVVVLWYLIIYGLYRELRAHSLNYRQVLLIGNQHTLPSAVKTIDESKALGLRVIGVMGIDEPNQEKMCGHVNFGNIEKIGEVLNTQAVDYAIFTAYRQNPQAIEKAMLECQERGIEVWLKPDFVHSEVTVSRVDYLHNMPLFILSMGPKFGLPLLTKRWVDIIVSISLLLILVLPMLIIGFLIHLSTKGPAIFKQRRVGWNGRKFVMYKFRTMYHQTEELRAEFRLKNEMHGPAFKMRNDPRITPIGRFLRRYSLDELPQFWNVLIGDMSLVGPRPPLPTEVTLYKGWQKRRLSMRPGLTCIWQVTGRNKIADFEQWAKLDLEYIDEWSLWLDFKILLMTVPAVLKGTGL